CCRRRSANACARASAPSDGPCAATSPTKRSWSASRHALHRRFASRAIRRRACTRRRPVSFRAVRAPATPAASCRPRSTGSVRRRRSPTPGSLPDEGTQPPGCAPFVLLLVVRDLDPGRFGFGALRDRYFEHAVLVRGFDRVVTDIGRKPEGPMHPPVVAFRAMNPRVLGPPCVAALRVAPRRPALDLHLD